MVKYRFRIAELCNLGSRGNCLLARTEDTIVPRLFRPRKPETLLHLQGSQRVGAIDNHHARQLGKRSAMGHHGPVLPANALNRNDYAERAHL